MKLVKFLPQNNSNAFHTGCLQFDQHVYITHRDLTQAEQEKKARGMLYYKGYTDFKIFNIFYNF